TAEVLSKMAGSATVCNPTRSYSGGRLSVPMHVVTSDQQVMRPLLTPDEAMRLPPRDALIFVAGHAPIYGRKIRYFEDSTFLARARMPPPTNSTRDRQSVSDRTTLQRVSCDHYPRSSKGIRVTCKTRHQ